MKNVRHFASGISNRISFNIPSNEMSPLGYIIAQVYQAPSHYLNQCWQGSPAHKCVTQPHRVKPPYIHYTIPNKANLRDLIAATSLVISNWIQIVNFSARVTVKFDGWPCKTIGHLFYATSSFVHLFVPIGEFKLKLQSGNAQSGSNWMIFRAVRPWNLTDDLAKQ